MGIGCHPQWRETQSPYFCYEGHSFHASGMVNLITSWEEKYHKSNIVSIFDITTWFHGALFFILFGIFILQESSREGELFGFVPDFYVESLTEMCTALRLYFSPLPESIPGKHDEKHVMLTNKQQIIIPLHLVWIEILELEIYFSII